MVIGNYERELLWHVGSSSRQFQSVSAGNCSLAGALTGRLKPEYPSQRSNDGASGGGDSSPDPGFGAGGFGGGGAEEGGWGAAGMPRLREQAEPSDPRA